MYIFGDRMRPNVTGTEEMKMHRVEERALCVSLLLLFATGAGKQREMVLVLWSVCTGHYQTLLLQWENAPLVFPT